MNEEELNEFLKMVVPVLKDLPEEEIRSQINEINDMPDEEKEKFIDIILMFKEKNK